MIDNDVFKMIVNGGSFAMMVLFFVWLLFKAEPGYRATMEKMAEDHRKSMEIVCKTFQVSLDNQLKECRAERKELFEAIQVEAEKNRESRHEFANRLQQVIAEIYENAAKGQQPPPRRTT